MSKKKDEYSCCFCGEEIPYDEIPKEVFTKIAAQVIFHNACLPVDPPDVIFIPEKSED